MTLQLYPDQQETIDRLRQSMRAYKSVLMQAPTGFGKTACAVSLITSAKNKNKRIIFTVPRRPLLDQTSETLDKYDLPHSYLAAGRSYNPYSRVYLGMVATMAKRINSLPDADLLIVDESHYGAGALDAIIGHYKKKGTYIIGLSATPWKLSGEGLGKWYDHMVQAPDIDWLIKNKRLSDYRYFHGKTQPDLSKIKVTAGDYAKGELAGFMEEQGVIIGDCVNDYRNRAMGRLHIVRCASIKHSQRVAASFRDSGISAVHVDGETPDDERSRIFRAYARREILVLTFCDLLGFGFDLSQASGMDVCIESLSDLKPSKSLAGQMQFWGRALRYKDYPAILCDHVNNWQEHGLPCSQREWSLADREQSKKSGDRAPPTRQCDECFFIFPPAPKCPDCGHENEIKSRKVDEVAGELSEIDKDAAKKTARQEQGRADTLDGLIALGRSRGYAQPTAWAAKVMAGRMRKGSR